MDESGSGPSVVLLPALSSISTRAEMRPLFDKLAPDFRVATVDWPGFGALARPPEDWTPHALSAFLNWFLSEILTPPHMVVAAGHAASYALWQAVYFPGTIKRLVRIAPTWRGPFPTPKRSMMAGSDDQRDSIEAHTRALIHPATMLHGVKAKQAYGQLIAHLGRQ